MAERVSIRTRKHRTVNLKELGMIYEGWFLHQGELKAEKLKFKQPQQRNGTTVCWTVKKLEDRQMLKTISSTIVT